MPSPLVVAVDGPSGSGKSSVCRAVAQRLGLAYLDTGAMYRAVTVACLERGVDLDDESAVAETARAVSIVVGTDPEAPTVMLDGADVTARVRDSEVSTLVSRVAANLAVRAVLIGEQRAIIAAARPPRGHGVVAEGRDITTVVAPDADVRVLLTASEQARLARRAQDVHGRVDDASLVGVRDEVLRRDADDSRVASFLRAAEGVVTVDTSVMDRGQAVQAVLAVVETSRVARAGRRA